eukprot:CAMPEP_0119310448 /NCGR_PEP_ID=MMETSP1333-20130426/19477_1 /TAXON_ID=418940 /ORGANISM="Scyphosphaera apsteinii, Strain RCC1455" /LENGTH=94 /DNA_ID=CAMNT_0007314631 /DNA_START=198 /DNA_END=485 /DNA_ORIENTATION=+
MNRDHSWYSRAQLLADVEEARTHIIHCWDCASDAVEQDQQSAFEDQTPSEYEHIEDHKCWEAQTGAAMEPSLHEVEVWQVVCEDFTWEFVEVQA